MRIRIDDVNPMGAVRMTRRGKFTSPTAQRYLEYKEYLKWNARQQVKELPFEKGEALRVTITFYMPIPPSWSQKKKDAHVKAWHTTKPDIDNLVKGAFDALNGIAWFDDNQVTSVITSKYYDLNPRIELNVMKLSEVSG